MGCDIHGPYVYGKRTMTRPDGSTYEWWSQLAEFTWNRDYACFGVIAGVRMEEIGPVAWPRGPNPVWDNDFAFNNMFKNKWGEADERCSANHEHNYDPDGCHSQSWLTTDELVEAQVRYAAWIDGEGNKLGPSADMAMTISLMRTAEQMGYEDVHIGFCFDS